MLRDLRRIYQVDFPSRVIANGIEPVHFAVGAKARQILSVGRMWDKAKNFQLLDSIAAKLEWPVLDRRRGGLPTFKYSNLFVHVRALGKLSAWAIREEFNRASIYAAPALYEPFGLAVLEAALSGCALVLADIPTFRELWQGAAVLLNPRDAHAWEAELQRLIHDEEARIALAQEARARASNFSREAMCASYHDLYHSLSGSKREPSQPKGRMNIAFFGSSLLSAYWNGAATYYRGIIRALHARGHRVTFYEPDAYDRQQHRDIEPPPWAKSVVYEATEESALRHVQHARSADLVVKASGVGVFDPLLERAVLDLRSEQTIVAFWDVDAPATLERLKANGADPFRAADSPL